MSSRKVIETYNEMPEAYKRNVGFPINYFNLSADQQSFVDFLIGKSSVKDTAKIAAKLNTIRGLIEDIDYNLSAIEEETTGE